MAKKNETLEVWMLARVRGENGEALPVRTKQTVGATFGRDLIFSNRALPYDGQDGAAKKRATKKRATKKAAAEAGTD